MFYNCDIEKDNDMFLVSFPDLENINTYGNSLEHALEMASEALNAVLEVDIARDFDFPSPKYTGGYPVQVAPNIEFSMQLRKIRGNRTQAEIAQQIGLSQQAYQKLENPRKANPTLKTLEKIARSLGCSLDVHFSQTV